MTLFEQVSKDIVAAMKAKDKVRLDAIRNIATPASAAQFMSDLS